MANPRTVVPLGVAPLSPVGPAALQYHGGPVIESVQVLPIFWGAAWQSGTNAPIITAINDFFDFILTSPLMDMLSEYSTPSTQIKHGSRLSSVSISETEPGSGGQVTDSQIQTALQGWMSPQDGRVAKPSGNTLYFIYLPPSVTVSVPQPTGTSASCAATNGNCGYHSHVPGSNIYYAVIPFDMSTCANCNIYGGTQIARLTVASSHELCEAITNPAGTGWYDPNTGNEIGDICAPPPAGGGRIFTIAIGNAVVQAEWSNSRCACLGTDGNPLMAYGGFSAGSTINNMDSTPNAVACCEFHQQLFLFWKANDSSNSIYFSQSFDGQHWAPGKVITTGDSTPAALACCVFNEQIFVFWKANDSSNAIYFSASPTGADKSWSGGQKINGIDSTPESLAACVFQNQLFLFWKADDPSNSIYFSSSATGQANSWSPGQKINGTDHTPQGLAACVFQNPSPQLYLFWKADDPSNSIYFSSSATGQANSWPPGQKINGIDSTPQAPAACFYCSQIYLFWKANDPSNSIYFSAYNDNINKSAWPPGKKINSVDHTPVSPSACEFAEQLQVFWKADDSSNLIYHSVLNG